MIAQAKTNISADDYFLLDQQSTSKLEYYAGTIVAQAGSTARHNLILANVLGHLYPQVRQHGCHMFPSDMRVQTLDQSVYTYPDITVVCATPQYADPQELTLLNPTLIIEILSPTTASHDRTEKFIYYRQIESLQEYILIAQNSVYVQRYTRQTPHFWYVHLTDDLNAQLSLAAIHCTLAMADIYAGLNISDKI